MRCLKKIYKLLILILALFLAVPQCSLFRNIDEDELARKVFDLVNEHRASLDLNELEWNDTIAAQCRNHCKNMASGDVPIGHSGFDQRTVNIRAEIWFTDIRENVGFIADIMGMMSPAPYMMDLWLENPGHRASIEGRFTQSGVGVYSNQVEFYFTQIFIFVPENENPE